jgi:hypothetical protein
MDIDTMTSNMTSTSAVEIMTENMKRARIFPSGGEGTA